MFYSLGNSNKIYALLKSCHNVYFNTLLISNYRHDFKSSIYISLTLIKILSIYIKYNILSNFMNINKPVECNNI